MPSLWKVLFLNNNINAVLKHVFLLVFLSVFAEYALGQNCDNLSVSVGSDIEACNGANITLTATYNGGPNSGTPIYQWSFNSGGGGGGYVIILGATSSTYTIPSFNNSTDGTYSCTVTFPDVNDCDDSDNVNVNFPNNNFDVNAGNDFSICQGSNATINTTLSNAPGGGNVTYAWNSVPIIPGTYPNQANPTFSGLPTGTYNFAVSATATDNGNTYLGCDIVQVIVNNLNLNAGNDQTICQGSPFTITSSISNNPSTPAVNYSWTAVNTTTGSPVTLTQTGSPSNPTFNNLPAGTYTFTGTASVSGCTDTYQIQVIVNPTPTTPTFTIPATGCPGVSIPISGFTPLANTTYSWYPNAGAFISGSTSNPSVTFNNGGNYNVYVTATNSNGCSSNSAIQNVAITNLQVLNPFVEFGTAALSSNNYNNITTYTICSGVSGSSAAYIYNTFPNGSSATYSYSYGTQPSSPIFLGIAEEIGLNIGNNYFTITGALNGCVVSETFNIYAGSNPYVAGGVSNSVGLCTGQTVNFAISSVNPTTNSPNATGTTYTIGVSDVSSSLPGAVNSMPYATYPDLIGNQNVSYTFNSSSCGQNPPGYPANTFYAVIQASNACGTTTSTVSPIVVSALPNSNFNVSATTICVNSSVTITNAGTSGNAITGPFNNAPFSCLNTGGFFYTISPTAGWTVSGGSIGAPGIPVSNWNGITAASNPATVSFNTSGTYIITQKYQNGCGISTSQRTVCVVAPPTCAFTVNPISSCTPLVTTITNNTTGPSCGTTPLALAYNWTVTNPVGGTSSVATATAVNPTITLNNNTVAPNLAALNFPITLVVNPLIPGTSTPVPNCSSTCNQTVTVYPQPSFITQPVQPPTVCLDGTFNSLSVTVSYLGPGLPSYQWYSNVNPVSSGGILIPGATLSSYVPPATVVGTIYYYCVVTFPSSTLCSTITSNAVPAIVWPDPIAAATPTTQTICVGATVPVPFTSSFIPGTGTASYQWNTVLGTTTSAINGATTSTYTPPVFTTTGSFNYSVTINTSGSGCNASTSAQIAVVVVADPTITVPIATQTLCQNATPTVLTVTASGGTGTLLYQWYSNTANNNTSGILISGATASTYSPPTAIVGTVYYYCVVTTAVSGCSVTSATAAIIVTQAPTFTTQPTASNVCVGGTPVQMCVVYANGTGTAAYQWYTNTVNNTTGGTQIAGETASCYTPPSTTAGTTYYYAVITLTGGGCSSITSNIAAVIITPDPVLATQPTATQTFCIGGSSVPLTVALQASTGIGAFTYQWFSNATATNTGGTSIASANAATYNPSVFNTAGTFYYYCVVTDAGNGCGTVASQVATVVVVADPSISAQPLTTQTLCQTAAPAVLSVTASGGTGTLLYQWYSNTANNTTSGTLIGSATSATYTPPTAAVGTVYYYCIITTVASGCSVTSAISAVIVNPAPTFTTQPATSNVCIGGTTNQMCVAYTNGTGTATYQWYSNATNSTIGGTAVLNATNTCYTPPSTTAGTTYYYAIISLAGGGCSSITSNTAEVIISTGTSLSTQPTPSQTICVGGTISAPLSVTYAGGVGTPSYQWYSSPSNTAIFGANLTSYTPPTFVSAGTSSYYVIVTLPGAGCGAQTSNTANIVVFADPTATISSNSSYCQNAGNVTALSVVVTGGNGTTSYQWYSNSTNSNTGGGIITGANTISYSPPVATTGTTYYYCMITQSGTNCAVNSPAAQIIVTPAPTFTSQPTAAQSVCVGGATTSFTVAYSNGTGAATYQWYSNATNSYTNGVAITTATTANYTPLSASAGTTYYYCIVSFAASGGCSMINSNIAEVVVVADPIISTQPLTTQTICVGGTIPAALNVAYTGGVGTPVYQWFGGTPVVSIPGAANPSYTPPVYIAAGTFNYYATISLSGSGCDALTSTNGTVIVVADPTATISSGASYCQNAGSVIALSVVVTNGQGTPSYQWYSNTLNSNTGGTIISGANAISYSPPVATTGTTYYYCMITQSGTNCAVNSPAAQIIVTPAPTFTSQPADTQSVCIGGATTPFTIAYSNGTGTATYQWYSNTTNTYAGGLQIAGQTLSSFTPPSAASNTTYYYCIISFSADGGCSMISSEIATVIVVPDPTLSTQPLTTQTICVGGTIPVAINVAYAGGLGNPTYQWFGGTPAASLSGATNSSFTPPAFTIPGTYNYYATVGLSGIGCDVLTTANATIIVVADPIVSSQPTVTQSVCQNTPTAQISVSITDGNGSATYQWYSNTTNTNIGGTIISGATSNTYIPPSNVVGTQYYYCAITQTGANCTVSSTPYSVVVNQAPQFSPQPLNTQERCLNASTANLVATFIYGTGTATYQWYSNSTNSSVGGALMNSATNNIFTPTSNVAGTYYYYCVVSFASGGGCPSITSNVSQVIIHPYPIVAITGGETICLLESSDINFAFTPSSGLYDITYTANGQSVTLDNYNGANPVYTATPPQTTTYVVTNIAYDQVPQCAIQPNTSILVNVNPLPALSNSNYTFCSDVATTSLQYIPDANTYTYNWLPNTSAIYPGQNNGPSAINVTLPNPIGNVPTNYFYVTNLTNNATGCHALDSILVTINPNPVGTFTLPTTGCVNSPIALSNGDATIGSYEWSIDGTLYSLLANPAPPVFTVLGDHTIEMVAINQYGCTDTLNSVIQIYDQPVANFTTDTDYGCAPLDVNFTNLSSGLYVTSYDWTFAPDTVSWNYQYSSTNLVNPPGVTYLQGDVTTIYTATLAVTNACGTVTAQHDITVLPTPVAAFTLATHTICSGSSLVLNNISVGEPLTYYWTYGNTISYNPNLTSMFFPSDSLTQVYPISLTLTNACGTDSFNDSITVLPDNIQGGFTTSLDAGCSPLTVTLTNTTFDTNLSATWHLDDPANTVIANQNSIQFTYFAVNNTTQNYNPYLVVTDGCANDTIYSNISVFANPIPNIAASQINICAGSTIDFSGSITGSGTGFGYAWDFGGLGTSNSAAPSFTFPAGSPTGLAIPVTLTATSPTFSGTNCSNNATTTIYVYENPDLGPIAFNTTAGCSDLGVTISNLPASTNQINWGDGTTNFNNSHTYINNGPSLLSYTVLVNSTNTYGTIPVLNCSTIANQIVSVYPTPLPQIFSSAINVCEGDNVDFIASTSNNQNTGISYFWNFGTLGTSNTANNSITYISGNSTGLQTPVQLTAFQNTSGTICSAAVNDNVYVYDTPDLTTALYSNVNNCSPLLVSISNLPTSTYTYNWGDGTTTSNPNHIYLNQGATPLNYNISIDATTFYPTLPMLTCTATTNQIVQVNPQPFASFSINPSEGCFYNPVTTTLENTSVNAIAPYVWNYDGIAHTTNSLNYIATFTTPGAHPVELVVTNQFGCTDSTSQDFIIYDLPTVTLNTIDDALCLGATTEFEIDGTGISTSSWDFGDGITLNLLNPTSLVHYYNQPGVYSVTAIVTNIYGCSDTINFPNEVIIYPTPTASFTTNTTIADIVYPYFEFYDNSAGAINYYWNFGDSNWSNDVNPTHTYNLEGNYLVELTVTNEYNCFDIATQIVQIEGIVVYIPNAFTPLDYNDVNDVFKPSFSSTEGIVFYELCIFDRWGKRIFQTNEIDEAWIGNSKENDPGDDNYYAQNDTYIYTLRYRKKARANDPQPDRIITGHVTIIR